MKYVEVPINVSAFWRNENNAQSSKLKPPEETLNRGGRIRKLRVQQATRVVTSEGARVDSGCGESLRTKSLREQINTAAPAHEHVSLSFVLFSLSLSIFVSHYISLFCAYILISYCADFLD